MGELVPGTLLGRALTVLLGLPAAAPPESTVRVCKRREIALRRLPLLSLLSLLPVAFMPSPLLAMACWC